MLGNEGSISHSVASMSQDAGSPFQLRRQIFYGAVRFQNFTARLVRRKGTRRSHEAYICTGANVIFKSGLAQKPLTPFFSGGEGEIRTHGTRKGSTVFETAAFDHSATSPSGQRISPLSSTIPAVTSRNHHPRTYAKTSGATIEASDSITYFGVSMLSFSQVIFSLGMAPE